MTRRLVVVTGPTASGKSALALDLAQRLDAEIIVADSQQVYRGLDIGTAKPSDRDRERVAHHGLDVAEPGEQLSAVDFALRAARQIEEITARGRRVLVVGGTGLWIRALVHGLAKAPPRDDGLREELEAFADEEGNPALLERLRVVDESVARRLHQNDRVRIIRALEVYELTGRPLSEHHARHRPTTRYPHRMLALRIPRDVLRARIAARTEAMLAAGWIEEVDTLLQAGAQARLDRVLGYAEVCAHLRGDLPRDQLAARIVARTWRYAKRQVLWLRQVPDVEWLEPPVDASALTARLQDDSEE